MTCSINTSTKTIRVHDNGVNSNSIAAISAGSPVAITLGPITNPAVVQNSYGTFTLTSYTDHTFTYTVDNIPSGLSPSLECNYPCKTCSTSNKNSCLSCFTT